MLRRLLITPPLRRQPARSGLVLLFSSILALGFDSLAFSQNTPGTYSLTSQTGGTVATTVGGVANPTVNYAFSSGNGYGGSAAYNGTNASGSLSGTIATTFTYNPRATWDIAPLNAVIYETCNAQAGAGGVNPAAAAADGLGDAPQNTNTNGSVGSTSSGTHYAVQTGASPLTLSHSPSASASMGSPTPGGYHASVWYTATATPVLITLTGATVKGNELDVLVGQQITATLSAGAYTLSNWQWSTSAGDAFKNYNPAVNPPASNQLVPLAGADKTAAAFSFYTTSIETADITCTATVTLPDGTQQAVTATIGLKSKKPSFQWMIDDTRDYQWIANAPPGLVQYTTPPLEMAYTEISYPILVSVPLPFTGGSCCITQLVTTTRQNTRINSGAFPATFYTKIPKPGGGWELPVNALDSNAFQFPFLLVYDPNADRTMMPANSSSTTFSPDPGGAEEDSPIQAFYLNLTDGGGNNWTKSVATDSYSTWLMYKPPGQNPVWVPLAKLIWSWSAEADLNNNNGTWPITLLGQPSPGTPASTTSPPQWSTTMAGTSPQP